MYNRKLVVWKFLWLRFQITERLPSHSLECSHTSVFSTHPCIYPLLPTYCMPNTILGQEGASNEPDNYLLTEICVFFPAGGTKKPVQILPKHSTTLLRSVNVYPLLTITIQLEGFIREAPYRSRHHMFCEKEFLKTGINLTKLRICSD